MTLKSVWSIGCWGIQNRNHPAPGPVMKANLGTDVNCCNSCNRVLYHHTTLRSRLTLSNLFIEFSCMFDIWHLAIKMKIR